jgi:hypothetical protein
MKMGSKNPVAASNVKHRCARLQRLRVSREHAVVGELVEPILPVKRGI